MSLLAKTEEISIRHNEFWRYGLANPILDVVDYSVTVTVGKNDNISIHEQIAVAEHKEASFFYWIIPLTTLSNSDHLPATISNVYCEINNVPVEVRKIAHAKREKIALVLDRIDPKLSQKVNLYDIKFDLSPNKVRCRNDGIKVIDWVINTRQFLRIQNSSMRFILPEESEVIQSKGTLAKFGSGPNRKPQKIDDKVQELIFADNMVEFRGSLKLGESLYCMVSFKNKNELCSITNLTDNELRKFFTLVLFAAIFIAIFVVAIIPKIASLGKVDKKSDKQEQ